MIVTFSRQSIRHRVRHLAHGPANGIVAVLAWLALASPLVAWQSPAAEPGIAAALAKVSPSLVRIHVVTYAYEDGRELKREASGSGTIITPEGHVLTNHHVAGLTVHHLHPGESRGSTG